MTGFLRLTLPPWVVIAIAWTVIILLATLLIDWAYGHRLVPNHYFSVMLLFLFIFGPALVVAGSIFFMAAFALTAPVRPRVPLVSTMLSAIGMLFGALMLNFIIGVVSFGILSIFLTPLLVFGVSNVLRELGENSGRTRRTAQHLASGFLLLAGSLGMLIAAMAIFDTYRREELCLAAALGILITVSCVGWATSMPEARHATR